MCGAGPGLICGDWLAVCGNGLVRVERDAGFPTTHACLLQTVGHFNIFLNIYHYFIYFLSTKNRTRACISFLNFKQLIMI